MRSAAVMRNAWALTAGTAAARLSAFVLGIVLARILGAEGFGRYSLALAIGFVLQPIADLGLTPYLARETARHRGPTEAALPTMVRAKCVMVVAAYAVTVGIAAAAVDDQALVGVIAVLMLAVLLDGVSMFAYAYFQGREAMGFEARTTAAAALVRSLGAIMLVLAFESLWVVVGWVLVTSLVQAGYVGRRLAAAVGTPGALRARRRSGHIDWRSVAAMGLMSIFVIAYLRIDAVFLGLLVDERAVGVYAAAYTLMMGAQIAPAMIGTALTPVFARSHLGAPDEFERSWHDGIRRVLLISLPVAVSVTLLSGPLIDRFYGEGFARSADVLAVIIWICPMGALSIVAQALLRGARREAWLTAVSGTCLAVNVALNLWAIPRYGVMGASWVTVVTEAVNVVALVGVVLAARLVPPPRFPLLRMLLAVAALAAVLVLLSGFPVELVGMAGVAAYGAMLVLLGVVRRGDVAVLSRIGPREG